MATTNTGYKAFTTLLKVAHGGPHDGEPLDINDHLCSVTGLPQATKSNNVGDPDYIEPVIDEEACPIDGGGGELPDNLISMSGLYQNPTLGWELTANSDEPVTSDVTITLEIYGDISGVTNYISVALLNGQQTNTNSGGWPTSFHPSDILTVAGSSCSPTSDINYNYIIG